MKTALFVSIFILSGLMTFAQEQPILLYPNGIPNSKPVPVTYKEYTDKAAFISKVSIPTITPYLPAKPNGAAIIIFPGGGYAGLASNHEGKAVALAFNQMGVTAFVVKYRLPSDSIMVDKTIGPLQDAQRAIQMVRQKATTWNIDPHKIGIIGFSAGGHLASTLGTHFNTAVIDNPDKISLRPDFMMLLYPVISFGPMAHVGSRENLVGKTPSQQLVDLYSNEKLVTEFTPPTFLVHAGDDTVVPVQNSLMFYDALLANKVKASMHIFEEGGHGFGLNNPKSKDKWIVWAQNWLEENSFL